MEGMNPPPQAAAWAVSRRPVARGDTITEPRLPGGGLPKLKGANVVASAAGSMNVSGLTYGGATGYTYGISPDTSTFLINPGPSSAIDQGSFNLPGVLGPGTTNNLPISGTGDSFGIALFNTVTLFVPNNSNGQYNGAAFTSTNQPLAGPLGSRRSIGFRLCFCRC